MVGHNSGPHLGLISCTICTFSPSHPGAERYECGTLHNRVCRVPHSCMIAGAWDADSGHHPRETRLLAAHQPHLTSQPDP